MSYRINDIFYSLQGEGHHSGRAAVFVRFSGCNLRCPFCDTDFADFREMSATDIVSAVSAFPSRFLVLTGGEPTLQADAHLTSLLHQAGFVIAIETNGTQPMPPGIDWITLSPKGKVCVDRCNELKVIFGTDTLNATNAEHVLHRLLDSVKADYCYLQPCDTGDNSRNRNVTDDCVAFIKKHPQWRLSLQTQKLAGFK